jgi:hypothetical protein
MRRPATALAATLLAVVVVAGPWASVGHAAGSGSVECSGAATSPACPLLDQLAAQLAPVQPVLAVAGPVTAQLGPALSGLASRADQPGGVPTAEAAAQAQALLDQLSVLPAPVRDLLAVGQLDGLVATLEALVAALAAPVTGDQTASDAGSPTPAATGGSSTRAAGPASPATPSLGGSVSASGGSATPATSSPPIPDVPVGDSLTFAPLALPDFGFSPTVGLEPPGASQAVIDDVQQALNATAFDLAVAGDGSGAGVVIVVSLLLLAGAWAAKVHQARQAHHTIPD